MCSLIHLYNITFYHVSMYCTSSNSVYKYKLVKTIFRRVMVKKQERMWVITKK